METLTPTPPVLIYTPRLLLRPYHEGDVESVHRYGQDAETSQYQAWGPNTLGDTRQFVARCVMANHVPAPKDFFWALTLRDTGELFGGINLSMTDDTRQQATMGYTIRKDFWRQGYTTEAARAVAEFGFTTLGLHRIISFCEPENVGSWGVMEKIGMRREGCEREAVWFKGCWHDWLRYALLKREWAAHQTPAPSPVSGILHP